MNLLNLLHFYNREFMLFILQPMNRKLFSIVVRQIIFDNYFS